MNRIEEIYESGPQPRAFAEGYLRCLGEVLVQLDAGAVAACIGALMEARQRGSSMFFIGNGGSAMTASHFAHDVAIGSKSAKKPFLAQSLCDNVTTLTAIANDHGYDQVFVRQLQGRMCEGDVVLAISASGNSPNVVKAIEYANAEGGVTIALTGFEGGRLKEIAGVCVHVPTRSGEYGFAEGVHSIAGHLVAEYLAMICRDEAGGDTAEEQTDE